MSSTWVAKANFKPDDLIWIARVADNAERYDDMATAMKMYTESNPDMELSNEYRNFLSVAYKNVVGSRRSAYRTICSLLKELSANDKTPDAAKKKDLFSTYQAEVVRELKEVCNEVLKLLENYLIKNASTIEGKVFYYKMQADYYRYLSEVADSEEHEKVVEGSNQAYMKATEVASSLAPTNPIKLGLALNFSVFHYEIMNSHSEAKRIANDAFQLALADLDRMDEESYKDSTLIMQLLRDNLQLWNSEQPDNQADGELEQPEQQ